MIAPTDEEMRVLGCLIEKQRTVPDHYPITLNSLRLACNQSTNRDPVVEYDEATVRLALGELGRRRWIRGASGHSSRTAKYRQLFEGEMRLDQDQVSVLAVLMLRGPQTPGELKQRADRLFSFHDLDAVHTTLDALAGRELVEEMPRRPGQSQVRYRQLIGGSHLTDEEGEEDREHGEERSGADQPAGGGMGPDPDGDAVPGEGVAASGRATNPAPAGSAYPEPPPIPVDSPETERIETLERQIRDLTEAVSELEAGLDRLRTDLGA